MPGRAAGGRRVLDYVLVNFLANSIFFAKYSTCVLQNSHMVSSGFLLSCDAISFQLVFNFLVKIRYFFYNYFFTNFFVYSITPKLFKVFGWTFLGMLIQMIRHAAHKWHNSSLLTFLVISLCIFSQNFVYALYSLPPIISTTRRNYWF